MLVKELIEELSKHDPEAEVEVQEDYYISGVASVYDSSFNNGEKLCKRVRLTEKEAKVIRLSEEEFHDRTR